MKNISLVFSILFFIVIFYGCSDDSVTEQKKTGYISSKFIVQPNQMEIFFDVQDTTITFSRLDSNLNFTNVPKILFDIQPTNGSGDIILRKSDWTNIYSRHFTGYMNDSITLSDIPSMSYFTLVNFTGKLSINLIRNKIYTKIKSVPDTLEIYANIQDTTYSFARLDSNLQFLNNPYLVFNINSSNGFGDFILRRHNGSFIDSIHFTGFKSDSLNLPEIPWLSYLTVSNYTGTLSIKLIRNN